MRAGTPAQHLHASRWGVRPPGAPCPTLVFSLTSAAVPACASAASWCLSCLGLLSGHSWGSLHSCSPGVGKPFALLPQHFVYSLTVPSLSHIVGHWPCAARSMGHTVFYSVLCKARPTASVLSSLFPVVFFFSRNLQAADLGGCILTHPPLPLQTPCRALPVSCGFWP